MAPLNPAVVGTSFYCGIPASTQTSAYDCVAMAADLGITQFFTSLQMPEADIPSSIGEFQEIGRLADRMGLNIMADVHPIAFRRVGGNLEDLGPFRDIGISAIRLDAGFSDEEVSTLLPTAERFGMSVVLNASPVTDASLDRLKALGVPLKGAVACHNYYPRIESGLSRAFVAEQARRLHEYGCVVMGFVASRSHRRYMTYEGLPTLECHRQADPGLAAQELLTLAWCDQVYIGDQTDDKEELKAMLEAAKDPCLVLTLRLNPNAGMAEKMVALNAVHTHLPQEFELVHRARGDRQRPGRPTILPQRVALARRRGTVTVDNALYPRFAGELQIARTDLAPDIRTNVVGWVVDEDLGMLDNLGPGVRFRFHVLTN